MRFCWAEKKDKERRESNSESVGSTSIEEKKKESIESKKKCL